MKTNTDDKIIRLQPLVRLPRLPKQGLEDVAFLMIFCAFIAIAVGAFVVNHRAAAEIVRAGKSPAAAIQFAPTNIVENSAPRRTGSNGITALPARQPSSNS